jgi:hypothetical protein
VATEFPPQRRQQKAATASPEASSGRGGVGSGIWGGVGDVGFVR